MYDGGMQLAKTAKPLVEYRGQDSDFDDLMKVPILRFSSIEEVVFDLSSPARYIVLDPRYTLPVDFMLMPRQNKRLMVGFHGAEMRKIADLPKFQFGNSVGRRDESFLALTDSTLLQGEKLSIGWFVGNKETPLASLLSEVVNHAAAALGVEETVLVGHSAGGFAAIRVGMHVPNSRAVVVNAQTVAHLYHQWVVDEILETVFPECSSMQDMVAAYPDRFDLRVAAESRIESSSFTFYAHRDDRLTFQLFPHFPLLAEHFGLTDSGGRTDHGDAFVPCFWESKDPSPHALPGTVMPFLQRVLGEDPMQEFEFSVDPLWNR
ncbi:hypothetical protein CGQ24_11855 [Arthrobacter sp. 7749]|nr:hypothetical protein CGQ24_11855 [Arthrobacter sp. 7749]